MATPTETWRDQHEPVCEVYATLPEACWEMHQPTPEQVDRALLHQNWNGR